MNARRTLMREMNGQGLWEGTLSSSALATATAAFALSQVDRNANGEFVASGLQWLVRNINDDGGWGDSPESKSNLSATLLCWSALTLADGESAADAVKRAEIWIRETVGTLEPVDIAAAITKFYGNDRTFSTPILTMCAIAGRLGSDGWTYVYQLHYEFAVLPRWLFRFLRLDVVGYALPVLISIGLARHRNKPASCPLCRTTRNIVTGACMRVLRKLQPKHGGFLEAAPLTSFVAMSLAAAGFKGDEVTTRAASFLSEGQRSDGSWPIDTNLSMWVPIQSVNALSRIHLNQDASKV